MADRTYLTFAEVQEGAVYVLEVAPIAAEDARLYYEACGVEAPDGDLSEVPPLMLTMIRHLKRSLPAPWPPGGLHVSEVTSVLRAVPFNLSLTMSTTVSDKYERGDRRFVEFEIVVTADEQDVLTCTRRMTWAA